MRDSNENGTPCAPSTTAETWKLGDPLPELTEDQELEKQLATSLFLARLGIKGSAEEICYQLVAELAKTRKANKDLHDLMAPEIDRYRSRFLRERELASDFLEEIQDLEETVAILKFEAESYEESFVTCQQRLENSLETVDALSANIDWNGLLND